MSDPLLGQPEAVSSTLARHGVIVAVATSPTTTSPAVSVDGVVQSARWVRGYRPVVGDAVLVLVSSGPTGQSSNLVVGAMGASPSLVLPDEARVTAVPASSPTITVAADGVSYTAKFVGTAPAVGDLVLLEHRAAAVYVIGKIGSTAAPPTTIPPAPPTAPPTGPTSGTHSVSAIDSGTHVIGSGWSTNFGQDVVQGTYGGRVNSGAWFYGTSPAAIAGRPLTGARMFLPARRHMGDYNAPATIHLWAHTSTTRPGGEPARTAGPHDITIPAGWGGGWVAIPTSLAAVIVAGGGLAIVGAPYAGLIGRGGDPQSGAVQLDWTT